MVINTSTKNASIAARREKRKTDSSYDSKREASESSR
jgi:hypothetical protein